MLSSLSFCSIYSQPCVTRSRLSPLLYSQNRFHKWIDNIRNNSHGGMNWWVVSVSSGFTHAPHVTDIIDAWLICIVLACAQTKKHKLQHRNSALSRLFLHWFDQGRDVRCPWQVHKFTSSTSHSTDVVRGVCLYLLCSKIDNKLLGFVDVEQLVVLSSPPCKIVDWCFLCVPGFSLQITWRDRRLSVLQS